MGATIEALNAMASSWFASILKASWQGALAIAAAWVLVRCRPSLPARVACWVWRLADLKLLIALLWATPLWLPLLPAAPPPTTRRMTMAGARTPAPRQTDASGSGVSVSPTKSPRVRSALHWPSLASWLFLLWVSGVACAVVVVVREAQTVIRLRRSCRPVDHPEAHAAVADLARLLGLRKIPEVRIGSAVAMPMLIGAYRPAILLPVELLDDPRMAVAIRPILAHELAHVRRGDLVWSGFAGLVRGLFFFHPLVWLAHREAHVARESACDALALRASGVRAAEYGRILVEIATGGVEQLSRWAATIGMASSAVALKRRLLAMRTNQQPSRGRLLVWAVALSAVGTAGLIPWRLVPRQSLAKGQPPVPAARQPDSDGQNARATTASFSHLKVAEAKLDVARAQRKVAEDLLRQAEAEAAASAAEREYWWDQRDRLARMERQLPRGVDRSLVEAEEDQYRIAEAGERAAEMNIIVARASLDAATAGVREAQAQYDINRAEEAGYGAKAGGASDASADRDLKAAQARLRQARLDRARSERKSANAGLDHAQATLKEAQATVGYRTKQLERLKGLLARKVIEQKVVADAEQALTDARNGERDAEAAIGVARARRDAAETRLDAAETEVRAIDHPPVRPPRRAPG